MAPAQAGPAGGDPAPELLGGGRPARVVTVVPRGTYRLVVADKVSLPIFLPPRRI